MAIVTKTTWDKVGFNTNVPMIDTKRAWLDAAIAAGKTKGDFTILDDLTSTLSWTNQQAADEWAAFITDLGSKNGYTVTVTSA